MFTTLPLQRTTTEAEAQNAMAQAGEARTASGDAGRAKPEASVQGVWVDCPECNGNGHAFWEDRHGHHSVTCEECGGHGGWEVWS